MIASSGVAVILCTFDMHNLHSTDMPKKRGNKKGKNCICHILLLHRETPGSAMCKIDWMKNNEGMPRTHTVIDLLCINETVSMVIALTQFYIRVVVLH